jgi:ElaB/YqjD/DUF883 family membrane-anchored ribosome-binding protein
MRQKPLLAFCNPLDDGIAKHHTQLLGHQRSLNWNASWHARCLMNHAMPNTTPFPASQKDLNDLKTTATDAVSDLTSTALAHAGKAKQGLRSLSSHVKEEGAEHLSDVRDRVSTLVSTAAEIVAERPLAFVAGALFLGFLFGLSRRRTRA